MEKLTPQELATMLAALKYWQGGITDNFRKGKGTLTSIPVHVRESFESAGVLPMNSKEIDQLCNKLKS